MIKKIHLILLGVGIGFTNLFNIGYILFIPICLYYAFNDIKNLFFLFLGLFIFKTIFNDQLLLILIIMLLIVLITLLKLNIKILNMKYPLYEVLSIIFINILSFLIFPLDVDTYIYFIYIFTSIALYLFLKIDDYLYYSNVVKNVLILAEHIVVIIACLGAYNIKIYNINLMIPFMTYFSIYYSRTYKSVYSLFLGIVLFLLSVFLFNEFTAILVLLCSAFYLIESPYLFFLNNVVLLTIAYIDNYLNDDYIYIMVLIITIFEFVYVFLIKKRIISSLTKKDFDVSNTIQIEREFSLFANFIDYFISTFKNTNEYNKQLSKAYNCIFSKHCDICKNKVECFKTNKLILVPSFKNLIEKEEISEEFRNYCTSYKGINETAAMLSHQMIKPTEGTNYLLLGILHEIKDILNKFQDEINNLTILDYDSINEFNEKLRNAPFLVKKIDYEKLYLNDFKIKIYIDKTTVTNPKEIKKLLKSTFKTPSKIVELTEKDLYIYTLYPKENINIDYGYGILSSKSHELCGDNYIINSFENSHFICAISDGMGKGFNAYADSKKVIDAFNILSMCSTSSKTNLEILNLLYLLQGYSERFSTFDCLDINRNNFTATSFKLGAAPSLIIHDDGKVEKIENKLLPLGVEDKIDYKQFVLKHKDLIIMTSDGVLENIINEKKFLNMINSIKSETPQKIAYEILNLAKDAEKLTNDDMTVIVLKITKIK